MNKGKLSQPQEEVQKEPVADAENLMNYSGTEMVKQGQQQQNATEKKKKSNEGGLNQDKRCCRRKKKQQGPRSIYLGGSCQPPNKVKNVIRNQKYNVVTFVFVVLYNQFKFFFNLFFLLIAVTQFFKPLQTGYLITYIGPLALVLLLTMAKEAYDDYERYKRDKEANSAQYKRFENGKLVPVPSSNLRVGDIIEVTANQRIPADLILLYTSEPSGAVFIRTDQLDGETDWKLRKAISHTQKYAVENGNFEGLKDTFVNANPPIENIYKFEGVYEAKGQDGKDIREALSLENTLWASTVLAAGKIFALVTYSGSEMRIVMNTREPRTKMGEFEKEVNYLSKLLFVVLVIFSFLLVSLKGFQQQWYIQTLRFLILLSSIIPISLRVNMDFAKMVYSYQINKDKKIEGTIARNRTIPEEVGRIQYLLTDKTGTLTQNEMIFKKISLETQTFTPDRVEDIKKYLKKNCDKAVGPLSDVEARVSPSSDQKISAQDLLAGTDKRKHFKREKDFIVRDMISALVLCHNVTPIVDEQTGEKTFQASSPDEIALVKIAEDMDMYLDSRDQNSIVIKNTSGQTEHYKILNNFPFSSETKRMGIVLQNTETGRIIFYLKGADTIMKDKVPQKQRGFLLDECESLAREGLRTLVITQKYLLPEEYENWKAKFDDASQSLSDREAKVRRAVESLETEMEFLGITGVEDKLQEDVCDTLENLRQGGIQVWMLTGDKIETATCIAISAGIKSNTQEIFEMKEITDPVEINHKLDTFSNAAFNKVLIIDGITLGVALEECYHNFFESACKAPAVVCCRCSPTQKALVTEGIKKITGKKTCAIGDGGNDVGMIQSADIGIGIEGKEGKQAALAADFSILKFKYLTQLFLWHGRLSYKRSAVLSQFVIHRGLTISVIQLLFSSIFYSLSIPIYGGVLMLGYSTAFTMFPVFCLIFDEDIDNERAIKYPPLYKSLQKGRELNLKTFLIWVWKSLYQGAVIMLLSLYLFEKDALYNIVTITFTSLIISEMLNITTELNRIHCVTIISITSSIVMYILTITFLKQEINASSINLEFLQKVVFLTIISWLPLHLIKLVVRKFDPSEHQKIMKGAKKRKLIPELENPLI